MTLVLNLILGLGVTVMVVTPLLWAIATQHRDQPVSARSAGQQRHVAGTPTARNARRRAHTAVTRTA